jgi:hypothetical protein
MLWMFVSVNPIFSDALAKYNFLKLLSTTVRLEKNLKFVANLIYMSVGKCRHQYLALKIYSTQGGHKRISV